MLAAPRSAPGMGLKGHVNTQRSYNRYAGFQSQIATIIK